MKVADAIKKRKSIRSYHDKPVSPKDLEEIIEAGRWAPNAGAFQISVIKNADLRRRINDATLSAMLDSGIEFLQQRASLPDYQPLYGAPVLILLSAPAGAPLGEANTALAAENMLLAATGLGLGSCFLYSPTMALNNPAFHDIAGACGIERGNKLMCALIVGHVADDQAFSVGERAAKGVVNYVD